jgi:hypothetical protein
MIIAITGPRRNPDNTIHIPSDYEMARFWALWQRLGGSTLVNGGAIGTDRHVARVARLKDIDVRDYPVNTRIDGSWPGAGHARNRRMLVDSEARVLVGFSGGMRGTKGCLKIGRELKLDVYEWDYEREDFTRETKKD